MKYKARKIKNGGFKVELIGDSNKTAGFIETLDCGINHKGNIYWPIYNIYIDKNFRNMGYGRGLYIKILKEVSGCGICSLLSLRSNREIPDILDRIFYKKEGGNDIFIEKQNYID